MDWNWNQSNNNGGGYRDIYPTAPGSTVGANATGGASAGPNGGVMPQSNDQASHAAAVGAMASPIVGLVVFIALTFGLMFLAKRLGTDDDFKSLKPSVYNVITISLAAVAGIPVWKYLANIRPLPGVTTWVNAA